MPKYLQGGNFKFGDVYWLQRQSMTAKYLQTTIKKVCADNIVKPLKSKSLNLEHTPIVLFQIYCGGV